MNTKYDQCFENEANNHAPRRVAMASPWRFPFIRPLHLVAALVFCVSLTGRAEEISLVPNAVLRFEFPGLSTEPVVLTAQLPANYAAEKKYPLFVYLSAGENRLDLAKAAASSDDFIVVGLPLPPGSLKPEAVGNFYRTMLQKLLQAVPNIAPEGGAMGGFARGADTVAALLAARDEFTLQHFHEFFLIEGGADALAASMASPAPWPAPTRVLVLRGDAGEPTPSRLALDRLAADKNATDPTNGLKLSWLVLRDYDGIVELPQYVRYVGQWVNGAQMPPSLLIRSRPELMQAFTAGTYTDPEGHLLPYRLFVPKDYRPDQKYPLILFLHGSGEAGDNNETQLVTGGPAAFIHPITQAQHPSLVLCPQIPRRAQWGFGLTDNWPPAALAGLLSKLRAEFSVDEDRIYITGLSLGGFGTWDMIGRYPELFAAAIPVAAAGDPTQVEKFKDLPIWVLHGSADHAVPIAGLMSKNKLLIPGIAGDSDMIAALEKAGGHPKFTVFEGQGHSIWPLAYNQPGLLDWLFSQKRPHPSVGTPAAP